MIDGLKDIKTIVTHENCPDGIASALILRDVLPDAKVQFVQYNTPAHRDLLAEPGMLFCDMTPPKERMQEFVDAGAIVLDHHAGAKDLVEKFGERGVFSDESGVSGAVLAHREVWLPTALKHQYEIFETRNWQTHDFAALAGIRDTWQRDNSHWREACAQAAALRFWPIDLLLKCGLAGIKNRLDIGETLLQRDEERDRRSVAEAYRFTVGNLRCIAFQGLHTSDIAETLSDEIDLVFGWHYAIDSQRGAVMQVSVRSRGTLTALEIAKAGGGGGHREAAGFKIVAPDCDPYTAIRTIVESAAQ